jgi:hypothetical protein
MSRLLELGGEVVRWLRNPGQRVYRVQLVTDDPETPQPSVLYAVGENGHLWHATLLCPCGCGASLSLNLMPDDVPCWELRVRHGRPTLHPSIRRQVGCKSHFFLRDGTIKWFRPRRGIATVQS